MTVDAHNLQVSVVNSGFAKRNEKMEEVYKERFGNSVCTAKQPPQIILKLTRKWWLKEKRAAVVHNNDRRPAFFSPIACRLHHFSWLPSEMECMGCTNLKGVHLAERQDDDVHLHGGSLFFVKWKGGDRVKGLLNYPFAGNQSSSKCMVMFRDFPGQNVHTCHGLVI